MRRPKDGPPRPDAVYPARSMRAGFLSWAAIGVALSAGARAEAPSRRLIVHADDLGQSHAINAASIKAFETGLVNSGAILAPCPWAPEIAAWARQHPDFDLGLQFTLTSEREMLRWGPVLGAARVPSLADAQGYFPRTVKEVAERAKLDEVEAELEAQVQKLIALGVKPTYVDSHMGSLFASRPLFEVYLRVARRHHVPALITRGMIAPGTPLAGAVGLEDVVVDGKIGIGPTVPPERWGAHYLDALRNLKPGVYFLEAHLGYDDAEARAQHKGVEPWGAAWRQRDFDFFTGDAFRTALREQKIGLVTWRELAKPARGRP
jgi:predicted glycoside hydrolase/deacetylase ChbG (UPF0249 family)